MRLTREQLSATLFKKNTDGSLTCAVDGIEVLVTKKYENFAALHVEQYVTSLALFNIRYKEEDYGLTLPLIITMSPSLIEDVIYNSEDYYKLTFNKGDIFLLSSTLVQRTDLVFAIFKLFVFFGLRYPFMTPENTPATVFRNFYLTGFNMKYTDSAVWSAIFSELFRQSLEKRRDLYRLGPRGKGYLVGMKNIHLTATKLTTKLAGSYLNSTIDEALITQHTQNSEIEDLLRR